MLFPSHCPSSPTVARTNPFSFPVKHKFSCSRTHYSSTTTQTPTNPFFPNPTPSSPKSSSQPSPPPSAKSLSSPPPAASSSSTSSTLPPAARAEQGNKCQYRRRRLGCGIGRQKGVFLVCFVFPEIEREWKCWWDCADVGEEEEEALQSCGRGSEQVCVLVYSRVFLHPLFHNLIRFSSSSS